MMPLLTSHWSKLSHMTISSSKGSRETSLLARNIDVPLMWDIHEERRREEWVSGRQASVSATALEMLSMELGAMSEGGGAW